MKKTFTKLAGGIMAASMILGTAGVAAPQVFADDPAGQVSIQRNDLATHEYGIYEIFKADKSGDSLINLKWGDNLDDKKLDRDALASALGLTKDGDVYKLDTDSFKLDTAQSVTEAITAANLANGEANVYGDADKLAKVFADALKGDPKTTKTVEGNDKDLKATFDKLTTGYYLIKDTKNVSGAANGAMTKYIVTTVIDGETGATIRSKSDVPTSEKKVKDVNDSTGVESGWQDAADYDTGDKIPFRLQATFGSAIDNYKNYYMAFVDNMSEGLTYNNDLKIVLDLDGDETTTNDQYALPANMVVKTGPTAGTIKDAEGKDFASNVYKWAISDVFSDFTYSDAVKDASGNAYGTVKKAVVANQSTAKVWAYYTATLDKAKCKQGAPGNPNDVKLEYQTNPDWDGKGEPPTDETPEDRNIVFTIQEVVNKYDEKGEGLAGAEFTLYKEYKCDNATGDTFTLTKTDAITGTSYTINLVKGSKILADHDAMARGADIQDADIDANKYYEIKTVIKSTDGKSFTAKGLDDGNYVLVETTIPDNYNSAENIAFTITIDHATTGDTVEALNIGTITAEKHSVGKVTDTNDTISTDVENRKGSKLPSTGGIGTTIFYVAGAAAAVTAVVLLTARKRAHKED